MCDFISIDDFIVQWIKVSYDFYVKKNIKEYLFNMYISVTLVVELRWQVDKIQLGLYFSQKSVPEKNALSKIGHDFRKQRLPKIEVIKECKKQKSFP